MYIRLKSVIPHHVWKKVVARFMEISKDTPADPDVSVYIHYECGKKVVVEHIEVTPELMGQKLAETMKFMTNFDDIEGYEYDVGVSYTIEEALKFIE